VAAQILWSGFLYGPDDGRLHQQLSGAADLLPCLGGGGRMGSTAGFSPLTRDPNQA